MQLHTMYLRTLVQFSSPSSQTSSYCTENFGFPISQKGHQFQLPLSNALVSDFGHLLPDFFKQKGSVTVTCLLLYFQRAHFLVFTIFLDEFVKLQKTAIRQFHNVCLMLPQSSGSLKQHELYQCIFTYKVRSASGGGGGGSTVCPHGTIQLMLNGFSWNFIQGIFC